MEQFQTYYNGLQFERAGLFDAIIKTYPCREVLYPGCSIHLTPSLFFPHVVYIDKSEQAERFFADEQSILAYINRLKHYKQSAYLRFIKQDYVKQPLPLREESFDVLLAIFAGGISQACKKYLKRGGLLVSNNHQSDAVEAIRDGDFRLISTIEFRSGQYVIEKHREDSLSIPVGKPSQNVLRQTSRSVKYIEHETYYVFERKQLEKANA